MMGLQQQFGVAGPLGGLDHFAQKGLSLRLRAYDG
jgi:hypothetical protein